MFYLIKVRLRITSVAFSLNGSLAAHLFKDYWWNDTIKCHAWDAPVHTSHFYICIAVKLLKWAPGDWMLKIQTYRGSCAPFQTSNIHLLFSGRARRWDPAVIKAYHWLLSAALGGLPPQNDSLPAWWLADTLWTTWSPTTKLADLTGTLRSSWCPRLVKDTLNWTNSGLTPLRTYSTMYYWQQYVFFVCFVLFVLLHSR